MSNPWLGIPLDDYEAHMALPTVGQARLLADTLEALVSRYAPRSVAVLGCSGGNGFDRLARVGLDRLVGVDINPEYVARTRQRYGGRIRELELHAANIEQDAQLFAPVDFICAALVLEYVNVLKALDFARRHCAPSGICVTIVQEPHERLQRVSPSPYASLQRLEGSSHWVSPEELRASARRAGFRSEWARNRQAADGKRFAIEAFTRVSITSGRVSRRR